MLGHAVSPLTTALALGVALVLGSRAEAASCFSGSQVVDPAKVSAAESAINSNAAAWIAAQGGNLAGAVRDVAASDPDFAATIVSQAKGSTSQQSAAIGSGLGQAAASCVKQPADAAKIQAAAASSTDPTILASYASTTGNTQSAATAATGGGGGDAGGGGAGAGGGGGVGTTTTTGTSTGTGTAATTTTTTGTTNSFTNLLTSGSASSSSATTPATATTVSTSVSAF